MNDRTESQISSVSMDENSVSYYYDSPKSANYADNQENSSASQPETNKESTNPSPKPTKQNTSVVFGVSLSSIMQQSGQPLPQHILESMKFIRKIAPNEVGVFRKNGNKARINKLREAIDNNENINFLSPDLTVFDIADTIKLYFRELPECLITNKLSDILLSNYTSNYKLNFKNI